MPGGGSQDGDQHEMKYFLSEPEIFLGEQDDSDPCRGEARQQDAHAAGDT